MCRNVVAMTDSWSWHRRDAAAAVALLVTTAVASLIGLIIPNWSMRYQSTEIVLAALLASLVLSLVGALGAAYLAGVMPRGLAVIALDILLAAGVFFLSFFSLGPVAVIALWLCVAAVLILPSGTGRSLVLAAGVCLGVISLVSSLGLLGYLGLSPIPSGIALHAMGTACVAASAVVLARRSRARLP